MSPIIDKHWLGGVSLEEFRERHNIPPQHTDPYKLLCEIRTKLKASPCSQASLGGFLWFPLGVRLGGTEP